MKVLRSMGPPERQRTISGGREERSEITIRTSYLSENSRKTGSPGTRAAASANLGSKKPALGCPSTGQAHLAPPHGTGKAQTDLPTRNSNSNRDRPHCPRTFEENFMN